MPVRVRRTVAKEARRNQILDAAEGVFFERGFEGTSVDAVAEVATVSKGLIYLYFANKHELFLGLTLRGLEELHRRMVEATESAEADTGLKKYRAIGVAYLRFSQEHPGYFRAVATFEASEIDPAELGEVEAACVAKARWCLDFATTVVEEGQRDGSIRTDVPARLAAVSVWSQMHGVIQHARLRPFDARDAKDRRIHDSEPSDLFAMFIFGVGQALASREPGVERAGTHVAPSWQQFLADFRDQFDDGDP